MSAHAHPEPDWRYWFDFVFFPGLAVALTLYDCRSVGWVVMAVLGFALWTFVEYWVHRTALHGLFWHATHEAHHRRPAEYVIFPVWWLPGLWLAFTVLWWALGGLSLFVGFTLGYVWFLTLHHALHHWDLTDKPWLQQYAIWHNRHHKLDNVNYGITTPFWDRVFATYR